MDKTNVFFRKGTKVGLRPLHEDDIPLLHEWANDKDLAQYVNNNLPLSLDQEKEWFKRASTATKTDMVLGIVEIENGTLIGTMGINKIEYPSATATTGAVIGNKEYRDKGYGTEAKMLLLEYAFKELGLRKIYSYVIEFNKRSIRYSEKCGYKEEARLPKHYFRKGKYWDKIILAVYKKDWEKVQKQSKTKQKTHI